jgi:hypothetical protein
MAKKLIEKYVFTPGAANVGTVRFPGRYTLEHVLLITNTTRNVVLYNFADSGFSGTTSTFTAADLASSFPTITQATGGYTTVTIDIDTSAMSASDRIQIYVDEPMSDGAAYFRPWGFGTDAIERMRVSNPESLIDADFEYGLQPTKWAGYGTTRGYPSAYDLPGVDLTVNAITTDFTTTSTTNSLITVTFSAVHNLIAGNAVNVSGLNKAITNFSAADGTFIIFSAPTTSSITYFARGVVGTANGQSLLTSTTVAKRGAIYTGASIPVTSATSNGATPSVITLNTTTAHGLIPGTNIHSIVASGTNAALATGPFTISSVPTTTSLTYTARAGGAVTTPATVTLYALANSLILHRPQDGGVIVETRNPSYGASVVRVSKKYFRYQSGKGFLWSTGTLFKPNYDIQSITASATTIGATITVVTDDINHGLQAGATIRLEGVLTSGYNGTYTVNSITNDFTFTVLATSVLGATTAVLDIESRVFVTGWHGALVRAGVFDDQNGVFWEYNGSTLTIVRRTSTFQITGTVAVTLNSNTVTGTNTRFTQQIKVGDKIVIRGMTHFVTNVISNTSLTVTPDYRGITASGIKASLTRETRIRQSDFNIDTIDGNGPSGYNIDLSKMQMMGIQFTWYGAGFIDYMVRGIDGNWITAHRIKNNNVNNESYMRSGNLPVRYSIENEGAWSSLTASMTNSQTTVPLADLTYFPSSGTVYIDNELISYTGKSVATGAGNLTGATRAATLTQYNQGTNRSSTAAAAATHNNGTGVILVSNTCSPTLTHWGSAMIMDGGYDEDRGYIFNYQRVNLAITTTTVTAFAIRLAPSVENSQVGPLGDKTLLNRSQLLLQSIGITLSGGGTNPGAVIVEGVLNPRNFANATWSGLSAETVGGQPSFAQVATSITWSSGTFALPGEQVFAFASSSNPNANGATGERLDLSQLKELTGSPLGGDFKYPDGPDVLAINVRMTASTGTAHVLLRWSEAQA